MIRSSNAYRRLWYYRRRKTKSLHFYFTLLTIVIILAGFAFYANKTLTPYIVQITEHRARTAVTEAINRTIKEEFGDSIKYSDLTIIERDGNNKITSIEVNTAKLNELTSRITEQVRRRLDIMKDERIAVPAGTLTGVPIFAAEGPDVYIKIIPAGNVEVEFVSDFTSAGTNKTKHRIYIEVTARVGLAVPLSKKETTIVTSIPVAETILLGSVPEPYVSAWKSMSD